MKKVLFATTALVMTAGVAAAEVSLSGSARMGIIDNFGADDIAFTSRIRVEFTLSGTSESGLEFGASVRADNAAGGNKGTDGSVFVSGAFGKLSMGDVDGAALLATGHVSGVGLTGLSDVNESTFIANGGDDFITADTVDPSAVYEYSTGDLSFYLSATNPSSADSTAMAVGVKYSAGDYKIGLGYETLDSPVFGTLDHIVLGGSATFGAITVKALYATADDGVATADQYAVSVDYSMDALTLTAFYTDDSDFAGFSGGGLEAYGLGAAYDLGGGATLVGGYASNQTSDEDAFDFGIKFSF